MFRAAFYKGNRPELRMRVTAAMIKLIDRGPYSHCEYFFSDGRSASSSYMDGGVRFKDIIYQPDHWDFVRLPMNLERNIRYWYMKHEGEKYDVRGCAGFIIGGIPDNKRKWNCSESMAAAMGLSDPWRYGPNGLYSVLVDIFSRRYLKHD